jgi:hypothetical protein
MSRHVATDSTWRATAAHAWFGARANALLAGQEAVELCLGVERGAVPRVRPAPVSELGERDVGPADSAVLSGGQLEEVGVGGRVQVQRPDVHGVASGTCEQVNFAGSERVVDEESHRSESSGSSGLAAQEIEQVFPDVE